MNRRRFIKGISSAGLLLPSYMANGGPLNLLTGQRHRDLGGGGGDPSALTTLINSLSAGQNSTALTPTWTGSGITSDDINWQNRWLYDPTRGWGFVAGKIQGQNEAMDYGFYREATNQFFVANCGFNEAGHVWDCIAYSRKTGKGYLVPGGGRDGTLYQCEFDGVDQISISVASSSAASQIGAFMTSGDTFVNGASAMDIHPNFFGPDQEALLIVIHDGLASWNPATDVWDMVLTWDGSLPAEHPRPVCVYGWGLGAMLCSSGAANSPTTYHLIDDENNNEEISDPPLDLSVDTQGPVTIGALIDDPSATGGHYVFVKAGANEVYQYNRGSNTWPAKSFTHPFTGTDSSGDGFLIAPVYPISGRQPAFFGLERAAGNPTPRIYIPEAA